MIIAPGGSYLVVVPVNLLRQARAHFVEAAGIRGIRLVHQWKLTHLEFSDGSHFYFADPSRLELDTRGLVFNKAFLHCGIRVDMHILYSCLRPGASLYEWFDLYDHLSPCVNVYCEDCYA